jgi:phosphomannomutase
MELFGTAGIRGPVADTVTPELALAVGRAIAADGDEFVVARDGRETGVALAAALEAGLESGGATVRRAGQLPTPALAYASTGRQGVMLTASHNPPADNGIKCFVDGQEYDRAAEKRIEERVAAGTESTDWGEWGQSTRVEILPEYRTAVAEFVAGDDPATTIDGIQVAVDCGNGMASLATPQVLRALGGDVRALNANVDGHFPGRESKPTAESLTDLRQFVADGDAAFGIGHDGDADRIVVVDGDGEVVHEDTVVAILAERYVREATCGDPVVVTTPNASARIDERVRAAGGRVERVRLGALHEGIERVRTDGDRETEVVFAAEPWKHIHTRFGDWIDGVTSAAVVASLVAAEGLGNLRAVVTERPYRKGSVPCPDSAKAAVMERLETDLPEVFPEATVSTEHGVRLELDDGEWILVRPSGTEPYVRVYAESETVDALIEEAVATVEAAVEA